MGAHDARHRHLDDRRRHHAFGDHLHSARPPHFQRSAPRRQRGRLIRMGHKSNKLLAERVASLPQPKNAWPRWIISGGGPGFLRPAPGSWGTVPPAALFWLMLVKDVPESTRLLVFLIVGGIASVLLIAYGKWAAAYYREPDPGTCVLDEYAG